MPRSQHNRGKALLATLALCSLLMVNTAEANSRGEGREQREPGRREHREPERREQREPERREQTRARISASEAARIVEQRYGGKVMNVHTRQRNGGVIYSVKILQSSGHMRTINVDGQSGAILN